MNLATPTPGRILVIGGGVAGTGAALAAAKAGGRVTLFDGGAGASTLATGALDVPRHAPFAVGPEVAAILDALGAYHLPASGCTLLTTAGVVRAARGRDRSLLDVPAPFAARIGVIACRRPGWDALSLARSFTGTRGTFESLDAGILRYADEAIVPDADLAARHDEDERLQWLAARIREALSLAGGTWTGLVLPPMLGVDRARADALSKAVGLPCGEAIGLPGGPAGLRFERARDRALTAAAITRSSIRIASLQRLASGWRVASDQGASEEAAAVVLATGGLLGGGIEYAPSEAVYASALPAQSQPPLRLAIHAPDLVLGAWGRPLQAPGSLFGAPPESLARPFVDDALLERAGVLDPVGGQPRSLDREPGENVAVHPVPKGLYVAGEIAADQPRTWLSALASGIAAGRAAAFSLARSARLATAASDEGPPIQS